MTEQARIFAVTDTGVVGFTLEGDRVSDVKPALEGADVGCIAVDPRDVRRVYVGTVDSGLYASADGGMSWNRAGEGLSEPRVMSVSVSPSHQEAGISVVYAGTEPSNLYRSEDGGQRWRRLPALRDLPSEPTWSFPPRPWTHHVRTIALHPTDSDWLAVGIELGGVMRSADGGATWMDHNSLAHSDAHRLLTHPGAPDRIYETAGQGVARSEDRGATWQRLAEDLDRHYAWAQAIDPEDPDLWYVSISRSPFAAHGDGDGQGRLLRSRGNGWTDIDTWPASAQLRRMPYALVTFPGQPHRLLAGFRGGSLLLTDDAGDSWTELDLELDGVIDLSAA